MRNRAFLRSSLLLLLLAPTSFAQNNALTIESYGVAQGTISGEYERRWTEKISVTVQGLASRGNRQELEYSGFGGGLGLKYYLDHSAMEGTYLIVSGAAAHLEVMKPTEGRITSFGITGGIGYKLIFPRGLVVDLGVSLAWPVFIKIIVPESELNETSGFGALGKGINLGLGFAW